jgi:hypothetical protein
MVSRLSHESRRSGALRALGLLPLLAASSLSAQATTGTLTGRLLDDMSGQGISNVVVRIDGSQLSAVSGTDGRFLISAVPAGRRVVTLQHVAYGERVDTVVIRAGQEIRLDVRMAMRAVQGDSIVAQATTELQARRRSTGAAMHELERGAIDEAARKGQSLAELLRDQMPSLHVESQSSGFMTCVEFRQGSGLRATGGCQMMAIYIDGVFMSAPGTIPPNIPLNDIERVEAISPGQAGVQYGTLGGNGVLLIETRRGPGPQRQRPGETYMVGFDWSGETRPYRWVRVTSSTFVANALGLGIGLLAADQCLAVDREGTAAVGIREGCGGLRALGSGTLAIALPIFASSYAARWGGSTERSRGRLVPSFVIGSVSALTGFLLLVEGQEIPAGVALAVGTPALISLSDRIFRVLR